MNRRYLSVLVGVMVFAAACSQPTPAEIEAANLAEFGPIIENFAPADSESPTDDEETASENSEG